MDNPSIYGWIIHPADFLKRNEPEVDATASSEGSKGKFLEQAGHECSDEMPVKG
jgi:hypothetical protein